MGDTAMWTLSIPVTDHRGRMQAWVQVAVPHKRLYERINPVRYQSYLIILATSVLAVIASWIILGRSVTRHLSRLTRAVDYVEEHGPEAAAKIQNSSQDEIRETFPRL